MAERTGERLHTCTVYKNSGVEFSFLAGSTLYIPLLLLYQILNKSNKTKIMEYCIQILKKMKLQTALVPGNGT